MPLINGVKMACEPCIRGHRSTKCTHANERLMVPVKRPGRPLSACPHLQNQLCGCSSVTAAIPRRQRCHCGTGTSTGPPPAVQPRPAVSPISDKTSPTKPVFRIQKVYPPSRPGSRKPSYDMCNLERIDQSRVNISPYQTPASKTGLHQAARNDYLASTKYFQITTDHPEPQPSAGIQNTQLQLFSPDLLSRPNNSNGPYAASTISDLYSQLKTTESSPVVHVESSSSALCCAAKPEVDNGAVAFGEPAHHRKRLGSGDSSRGGPELLGISSISSGATAVAPVSNEHSEAQLQAFPTRYSYGSHLTQTTTFSYPPTYGSHQHPLQPWEWRRSIKSHMHAHAQPILESSMPDGLATFTSDTLLSLDTIHTCGCGDACQCVGCAAHPYNDATQNYIRSAYNILHESSNSDPTEFINGHTNSISFPSTADPLGAQINRIGNSNSNGEDLSPVIAETPSDSSTAGEQTLSASDYFFVNYPFSSEGCGGNTNSCPCGDDCECIGCELHRFQESTVPPPSNSWAHEYASSNGDSMQSVGGALIKEESLNDGDTGGLIKSCCG